MQSTGISHSTTFHRHFNLLNTSLSRFDHFTEYIYALQKLHLSQFEKLQFRPLGRLVTQNKVSFPASIRSFYDAQSSYCNHMSRVKTDLLRKLTLTNTVVLDPYWCCNWLCSFFASSINCFPFFHKKMFHKDFLYLYKISISWCWQHISN